MHSSVRFPPSAEILLGFSPSLKQEILLSVTTVSWFMVFWSGECRKGGPFCLKVLAFFFDSLNWRICCCSIKVLAAPTSFLVPPSLAFFFYHCPYPLPNFITLDKACLAPLIRKNFMNSSVSAWSRFVFFCWRLPVTPFGQNVWPFHLPWRRKPVSPSSPVLPPSFPWILFSEMVIR